MRVVEQFDVEDAAPAPAHVGGEVVAGFQQPHFQFGEQGLQASRVAAPAEMYLPEFYRSEHFGVEPAAVEPEFGGTRRRRHHAAFLDDHWHGVYLAIDHKIGRYAEGQGVIADGIFRKAVDNFLLLFIAAVPGNQRLFG